MRRIDNLTGVRALAALWVVLFHLNLIETPVAGTLGTIAAHGLFGVDLFFVLSGFVLSLVYVEKLPARFDWTWYRRFLGRRFAKIYPLHLLTLLGVVALFQGAAQMEYPFTFSSDNTLWNAVCSALMLHSFGLTHALSWNTQSWSVSAEWFAYALLFTPMAFGLRRVPTKSLLAAAVVALAGLGLLTPWMGMPWTQLAPSGAVRILPEFFCGFLLYRLVRGRAIARGDLLTAAGFVLLVLACYLPNGNLWLMVPAVMTLLAGLYAGGRVADRVFGNRVLVALGDASYSIYLVQTFVQIATKQALRHADLPDTRTVRAGIIVAVPLVTVLTGLCTFRWIEEPLRQAVLRRFEKRGRNPENIPPPPAPGLEADTQVAATIG